MKPSQSPKTEQVAPYSISIALCSCLCSRIYDAFLFNNLSFSPQIFYVSLKGRNQDLTLWLGYPSNQQSFFNLMSRLVLKSVISNILCEPQPSDRHPARSRVHNSDQYEQVPVPSIQGENPQTVLLPMTVFWFLLFPTAFSIFLTPFSLFPIVPPLTLPSVSHCTHGHCLASLTNSMANQLAPPGPQPAPDYDLYAACRVMCTRKSVPVSQWPPGKYWRIK